MRRAFPLICILIGILPSSFIFAADDIVPYFATEYEFLQANINVIAVDSDYLWASGGEFSWDTYSLYRSNDFGDN